MKKKIFYSFLLIIVVGCNQKKSDQEVPETIKNEVSSNNIGGAWADDCNFSFEFNDDYLYALGGDFIKYLRINDSLVKIIYPKKPKIIKNFTLNLNKNFNDISFDKSMGCCIDVKKKVIIFGGDRLKYKLINENKIKVYFPKESYWKISRISSNEILISNKKNKVMYKEFQD